VKINRTVLLTGIDTLAVGFSIRAPYYVDPDDDWNLELQSGFRLTVDEWIMLAEAKVSAQGKMFDSGGTSVIFRGQTFSVSPKGSHGYEYILVNSDVTIQLAEEARGGMRFPEVRVTFRSEYLWRHGWQACYFRFKKWLDAWAEVDGERVSRVDLTIDLALSLPEISFRDQEVVTPAHSKTEYYQRHLTGLAETGFTFGKGDLVCRIYDKVVEISHSNKIWFEDLWRKQGWDGISPVTRVEFQCRRGFLKDMQISSIEDLDSCMGDLMRYLSCKWLSLRDKNPTDSNRSRWPLKSFWLMVLKAGQNFGPVQGIVRLAQRKPKMDAIKRLVEGCLVTAVALMVDDPSGGTFQQQQAHAKTWLQGVLNGDFSTRVISRSAKLASMTV